MVELRFRLLHLILLLIFLSFYTKVRRVANIQAFVAEQSAFLDGQELANYGQRLREIIGRLGGDQRPVVLLLNKFALNITLNFLCNLRQFPGAIDRVVAVVFDAHSLLILQHSFPDVGGVLHWHFFALEEKFSAGDGRYQLFQFFRAKLAALLTGITNSFWMVQADTIWKENLFQLINLENADFRTADLVLDSEGSDGLLKSMIAGGYFFVRSSPKTKDFFESLARYLMDNFATDNNVMARQCILGMFGIKCAQIPYSVISNWRRTSAMFEGTNQQQTAIPSSPSESKGHAPLFQFDGGDGAVDKFEKMRAGGYLFVNTSTIPPMELGEKSPHHSGSEDAKVKCYAESERQQREAAETDGPGRRHTRMAHMITAVHSVFELVHGWFPGLKNILLTELFPRYAAYLFI